MTTRKMGSRQSVDMLLAVPNVLTQANEKTHEMSGARGIGIEGREVGVETSDNTCERAIRVILCPAHADVPPSPPACKSSAECQRTSVMCRCGDCSISVRANAVFVVACSVRPRVILALVLWVVVVSGHVVKRGKAVKGSRS